MQINVLSLMTSTTLKVSDTVHFRSARRKLLCLCMQLAVS